MSSTAVACKEEFFVNHVQSDCLRVILSLVSDNELLQSMPHIHQTLLQSSLHTRIT